MVLPPSSKAKSKTKTKISRSRSQSVFELDEDARKGLKDGIEPPANQQIDIDEWEQETGRELGSDDVDQVAKLVTWCYVKWDDLQYDQCESQLLLSLRMGTGLTKIQRIGTHPLQRIHTYIQHFIELLVGI